jgi:hypothetical protein
MKQIVSRIINEEERVKRECKGRRLLNVKKEILC